MIWTPTVFNSALPNKTPFSKGNQFGQMGTNSISYSLQTGTDSVTPYKSTATPEKSRNSTKQTRWVDVICVKINI